MGLMYERAESEREIVITYRPYLVYITFVTLFLSFISGELPDSAVLSGISTVCWLALIIFFIVNAKKMFTIRREISQSMKSGKVSISGGRFSFKNPATFTIEK